MSEQEYDSDSSVTTEDMNTLLANKPSYDNGVERSSKKKEKIKVNLKDSDIVIKKPKSKKSKEVVQEVESETVNEIVEPVVIEKEVKSKTKKPRSEKQIKAFEALRERQMKKKEENLKLKEAKALEESKKKPGRPKTKEIIHKVTEKIIYMIPNKDGQYEPVKNPKLKLTKKELQREENLKKLEEEEVSIGHKLLKKRNGTQDLRSNKTRSQAQIDASKKLVEANRKRAEERRNKKKEEMKSMINEEVTNSMVDVVTTPLEQIKQKKIERKPTISPEQQQANEFKQHKNLFC
eukprot:GHVU01152195.1.p2 GENE.GHVU01152195.1~~GHVU01152195.1.p2  ORF type:complete len:292 (+),score=65.94 GHVU01152195.1:1097-1972(+)